MKLTQIAVFLALAVTASSYAVHGAVLDTDGEILRPGASYYVLPVFHGRGGGLTLGPSRDKMLRCPFDVVQEGFELDDGIPVKFYPWNSKVGFVPESSDLNVEFDVAATICIQSTVWKLDAFDEGRKRWIVTTSGTKWSPFVISAGPFVETLVYISTKTAFGVWHSAARHSKLSSRRLMMLMLVRLPALRKMLSA